MRVFLAYRHGGRYFYTWIAVTIFAFNIELLAITVPDLNISWHAQGVLRFFGMRVPLYALFGFHQMFIYTSYVLVSSRLLFMVNFRMRLPWWAEGPGVGLSAMMLQLPFRILGTKMLWWTWHDTDPTIKERLGLHQPIGKCREMESIHTPAGSVLHREKYLCATKYDEAYFDFHCVPNGIPKQQDDGSGVLLPLEFYPICGTDFKNRAEYITVIW
ncbi:hypothetical protein OESDEN_15566 [Oesophagostomum dentatum]|uniref:DUF7802 domain-containing protein n=1 Tax=Oesophagostomum dentatum TaxID=61180 RepID=A0A0B1SMI0_OESDE|nr:hypothetical protein OESDEN_15566 [Oesophagostomum dentatum]